MRLRPGDSFDRYVIEALLGEGGMGEVYRAHDMRLERKVALKVLRREAAEDPEAWNRALVRMLREARAAAALSHPNTVAIYDIGEHERQPYLAMELIAGESLRKLMGGGASPTTKLGWLLDVARALSAAHRAGLVHRDVKPENVMLREDGVIKVLDFGIVRRVHIAVDEAASTQRGAQEQREDEPPLTLPPGAQRPSKLPASTDTVTGEGVMVGTPAYMAPEQLRGEPVDARTDQFGWGVLAYELLSGKVPFGAGLEGIKLLSAILSDEPPGLDGLVPLAVERILRRTVAKRKSDRLASMDHVIDALTPYVSADAVGGLHDVLIGGPESTPVTASAEAKAEARPVLRPDELADDVEAHGPTTMPAGGGAAALKVAPVAPQVKISEMPAANATLDTTKRSPDVGKGGRVPTNPPPPIVRIENATTARVMSSTTTLESPTVLPGKTNRASRPWWFWPIAGLSGIWALALGVWVYWFFKKPPPPPPVVAPQPKTASTPITDLPATGSMNPEALGAYKEGLQALRDASWEVANAAFSRATKLDPSFGAAYLRLALTERFRTDTASTRVAFQRAVQLRGTLTERDEVLLDALEPLVQRDPSDTEETIARITRASQRYTGDAEFVGLLLVLQPRLEPEKQVALADHCLSLDGKYADCAQARSFALFRMGREQESLAALDRCVESTPASVDCLLEKVRVHKYLGQCDKAEADARRWITKAPDSALALAELAGALYSGGQQPGAVEVAVEQAANRYRAASRVEQAELLRIHHAMLYGDFDGAIKRATDLERAVASDSLEERHVVPALALVETYEEMGDLKQAAKVAESFLSRRAAFTRPVLRLAWWDSTPRLIRARQLGGQLDEPHYASARDAWAKEWEVDGTGEMARAAIWFVGYADPARTEADAREAAAKKPLLKPAAYYSSTVAWIVEGLLGQVYFLSGAEGEALPHLERAARSCTAFEDPILHTITTYRLGVAREALHDKRGACESYKTVLSRWGREKRSVTAKSAASRAKALKCDE